MLLAISSMRLKYTCLGRSRGFGGRSARVSKMRLPSCEDNGDQPPREICQQANAQYVLYAPACQKLEFVSVVAALVASGVVAVCMYGRAASPEDHPLSSEAEHVFDFRRLYNRATGP